MQDIATFLVLLLLYLPVTVLINRLRLSVSPRRREAPAQGTVTSSALLALCLFLVAGGFLIGDDPGSRIFWLAYLTLVLGSVMLIYVSVMCVSESGRRFYLMHLIEKAGGIRMETLRAAYGREHMLELRLHRLCLWNVLRKVDSRYILVRKSAYLYSLFFYVLGRILGFRWFD